MEELEYRKAGPEDIKKLAELRQMQLQSEGTVPQEDLREPLEKYFATSILEGSFVSWLAVKDGEIVATSGVAFYAVPPYYGLPDGKMAEVANMFTLPAYRRLGIAKKLLGMVVEEARLRGCCTVRVSASQVGISFYKDFGFMPKDNFLTYWLGK